MNNDKISQYLINREAWDCIWDELIIKGKGLKTVYDRPGTEESYNFSAEMLEEMIREIDRLISKYGSSEWSSKETANRLVELISEHRLLIQAELIEVNAGLRKLSENDFLGPKEREERRQLSLKEKAKQSGGMAVIDEKKKDYSEYFHSVEKSLAKKRREKMRMSAIARGKTE